MSPRLLRVLRAVERDTRRLASPSHPEDRATFAWARYPRDYYRPAELLWRWCGAERRVHIH